MFRKYLLSQGPSRARWARVIAKSIDLSLVIMGIIFFYPMGLILGVIYLIFSDSLYEGQSIGKRFMGFHVISLIDGKPCTLKQSFIRNTPFIIPLCFLLFPWWGWYLGAILSSGLVFLELHFLFNLESAHRLGDVLADTTVIGNDFHRLDIKHQKFKLWEEKYIPMQ